MLEFSNHLLCELPLEIRAELAGRLRPEPLRAGEILQAQGEALRTCYFIESGVVSLARVLSDGSYVEAGLVGREGMVGSVAGPAPAFVEAKVHVAGEALCIEVGELQTLLARAPVLRDVLGRYHQYRLEDAQLSAACNAAHAVEPRLAKWLLRCLDRVDTPELPVTHDLLAELLGVQRTTVTASLQRLAAAGAVRSGRGRLEVLDRDLLQAVACECYQDGAERLPELGLPEAADRRECPAA